MQYAVYTNFHAQQLDSQNPEVPHDPDAFLASAHDPDVAATLHCDEEMPIQGQRSTYDFEAMLEAELRRQQP